uniref:Mitochondrial carrier protein n=1 Tax=Proboscia inermis TaxID=420281 RepID=A0A7S0GK33_9STRA
MNNATRAHNDNSFFANNSFKMLYQTGEHGLKSRVAGSASVGAAVRSASGGSIGVIAMYRNILRNEGIMGLWAGNGANLLRVFPAKGIVFCSNDYYKNLLTNLTTSSSSNISKPSPMVSFFAGGLSGMTASAITYPLDLARGRISGKMAGVDGKKVKHYTSTWNTISLTVREEGVRSLYKGITPTLLGAIPYEGIKFGTVGLLERLFPPSLASPNNENDIKPTSNIWRKMAFGGMGGIMAGLITYPNDTIRRMLQLQGSRGSMHSYNGYWDCVRKVYAEQGISRFYRGVFVNIVRMGPNTAIQFGTYELLKELTE